MRKFRIAHINLIIQGSDSYIHKDLSCFETREVMDNEIVARVPMFYLACLPNRDSVETIKDLIDAI